MRITRTRGLALAIAGAGLLAAPLALPAEATTPHVACAKLSSTTSVNLTTGKGTVTSSFLTCTPTALKAGGSSKVVVPISKLSGSIASKITWKNGKGTTNVVEKFTTQKTIGKCPAGTKYRTIVAGTTKGSTGAAAKVIKNGETISAEICTKAASSTKYVSTLLKGTKFKL
jgi:hypothetical protein